MTQAADVPPPTDRSPPPNPSPSAGPNSAGEPDSSTPARVRKTLRAVGTVVAPTTLVAALLYWFGEVRVRTQATDFGVDHSVFGFSNQDYVRRAVTPLFLPLGIILLIALTAFVAHWAISHWAAGSLDPLLEGSRRKRLWSLALALAAAGAVCFAIGVYGAFYTSPKEQLWPPILLGVGVALPSYATYMWQRFLSRPRGRRPGAPDLRWVEPLCVVLVALLLVVALFWAVSDYAAATGHGATDQLIANGLASRPDVVVYSDHRLHIEGNGVGETVLSEGEDGGLRFRYTGLKLLLFNDGKYFLLPATWTYDEGRLIVLPDNDSVRLEFSRPR